MLLNNNSRHPWQFFLDNRAKNFFFCCFSFVVVFLIVVGAVVGPVLGEDGTLVSVILARAGSAAELLALWDVVATVAATVARVVADVAATRPRGVSGTSADCGDGRAIDNPNRTNKAPADVGVIGAALLHALDKALEGDHVA